MVPTYIGSGHAPYLVAVVPLAKGAIFIDAISIGAFSIQAIYLWSIYLLNERESAFDLDFGQKLTYHYDYLFTTDWVYLNDTRVIHNVWIKSKMCMFSVGNWKFNVFIYSTIYACLICQRAQLFCCVIVADLMDWCPKGNCLMFTCLCGSGFD